MEKKGYSRIGMFGNTIHYDQKGRKVGEIAFWFHVSEIKMT